MTLGNHGKRVRVSMHSTGLHIVSVLEAGLVTSRTDLNDVLP